MNDHLSDLVVRIKNAMLANNNVVVELPLTKMNQAVAEVLATLGYVTDVRVFKSSGESYKRLHLKPTEKLSGIKRISTAGRRVYTPYRDLKPVLGGIGMAVLSTPKGVLSSRDAKKKQLGGEVLLEIW